MSIYFHNVATIFTFKIELPFNGTHFILPKGVSKPSMVEVGSVVLEKKSKVVTVRVSKWKFKKEVIITCYLSLFVSDFTSHLRGFYSWKRHNLRWRAANFDLNETLMGHWGFFSGPHRPWHWLTVYNSHLQGHVIFTPFAACLALEL